MKYLTKQGFEKLKKELEERKTQIRQRIAKSIKEAKEQGDLSENAEYAEAKSEQRENESRIMHLENVIRTSEVVGNKKVSSKNNIVGIGSEVEAKFKDKKTHFYIVGSTESNPAQGMISNESPIGKAFMGKSLGETAEVKLPNGKKIDYKIISIK